MNPGFCFFQFCDVTEVAIIHKMILARFGYRLNVKVGKKKKPGSFYILAYLLEFIIKRW